MVDIVANSKMGIRLFKDEFGIDLTEAQILDPHFLYQEIAKAGYSISVTSTTKDLYLQRRSQNALLGEPDMVTYLNENHVFYTYQLLGGEVASRGAHNSPICEHPVQALQVAWFNILRLNKPKAEARDGT